MSDGVAGFSLGPKDALFLDLDGTLAELRDDPDAVGLDAATTAALLRLAARLGGAVAVISGRDIRDLAARVPEDLWRAGGHGLEVIGPGIAAPERPAPLPEATLAPLRAIVAAFPGTRLELKGPVAALHFRAVPGAEAMAIAAAEDAATTRPGLVAQPGKMVVEVKPAEAHKGNALRAMMAAAPFRGRRPVVFGDDTTDEDAILAALDLGGVGVKVGAGPSAATLRAEDPAEVRAWLAREAGR